MNKNYLFAVGILLAALLPACQHPFPPASAIQGNPMARTITYGGSLNYNPSTVTIAPGGSVIWDSSFYGGHTLYIDNGAGICATSFSSTSFPVTVTFPNAGSFKFHCSIHTACGTTCGGCTGGMQGLVLVQ